MEYLTSHLYFLRIHTSVHTKKIQLTSGIFHGIPRERSSNYCIPCHRKYSGQQGLHNQCKGMPVHGGTVGCDTVELQ